MASVAYMTGESISQRPHLAARSLGERSPIPRLDGLTVLVVDDEYDARRLMKRFLEVRGATVTTAASAEEAMELLTDQLPDVLLSDIGMPEHDGYELIQRVRGLPKEEGGSTPAVAITAFARADDRERALMSGFQIHMAKPVDPLALLSVIERLAGRRH